MKILFVQRLEEMMRVEKISQYSLAKKLNISQSAISNWLSYKKEPSIESMWKLADYFDVTLDYLVGRNDD